MHVASPILDGTGLEVVDIATDASFANRHLHARETSDHLAALQQLAERFITSPDTILQDLVNTAVTLCGADSAGISIARPEMGDDQFYHWVATAGEYSGFLGAILPRYPSACGVTIGRGTTQNFRVHKEFFDLLGVTAPLVTDGLLLPWEVDGTSGTIFVMAHGREQAFDAEDARIMKLLADFAAMGYRHQKQQQTLLLQTRQAAAAEMANKLAHRINNPLQSLTNTMFLAEIGHHGEGAKEVGQAAGKDLARLSELIKKLLALPFQQS